MLQNESIRQNDLKTLRTEGLYSPTWGIELQQRLLSLKFPLPECCQKG